MIDFHPNDMVTEINISISLRGNISQLSHNNQFHLQVEILFECDVADIPKDMHPETKCFV